MNMDFVLGIVGLCGGLLCAVADILLDYYVAICAIGTRPLIFLIGIR
jgi:hypothetical protein